MKVNPTGVCFQLPAGFASLTANAIFSVESPGNFTQRRRKPATLYTTWPYQVSQ
ncbi:UNVERIFIED_CONTAM: hypothetical protein FKN15_037560 [Acipenser sinensis]